MPSPQLPWGPASPGLQASPRAPGRAEAEADAEADADAEAEAGAACVGRAAGEQLERATRSAGTREGRSMVEPRRVTGNSGDRGRPPSHPCHPGEKPQISASPPGAPWS